MNEYTIVIEETISDTFTLKANNAEDALAKAMERYQQGDFVLAPGELQAKQMKVFQDNQELTDWIEF